MSRTRRIPLLKRNGDIVAWTLVDEDMYEELNRHTWRYAKGYASRGYRDETGKYINVWMHRVVLGVQETGLEKGFDVDHINRDSLDNRRGNLRIVTHRVNGVNAGSNKNSTSKYKGVHLAKTHYKDKVYSSWTAQITVNGEYKYLGRYSSELDAFIATEWARLQFGIPLESSYMPEVIGYLPQELADAVTQFPSGSRMASGG